MKAETVFIGGANRGGKTITDTALKLLPWSSGCSRVVVADPKENRAEELAREWNEHGIRSQGFKEPCEEAIEKFDPDKIVLSIDTVKPMSIVLKKKPLPTQWQLLARGMGKDGPIIGLSGTVVNGDKESRKASIKLIDELGSFIKPQSSGNIRVNPLNADGLQVMRRQISEHSVRRLKVLDREPQDIDGGVLNFLWRRQNYPLMVFDKVKSASWKETKGQALEAELPVYLKGSSEFAVATVGNKSADFFLVQSIRGRRMVKFHMPLVHALPTVTKSQAGSIARNAAAGLGLMSVMATIAAAVVTD